MSDKVKTLLIPFVGGHVGPACTGCGKLSVVASREIDWMIDGREFQCVLNIQVCALCGKARGIVTPVGTAGMIEVPLILMVAVKDSHDSSPSSVSVSSIQTDSPV
jgi:hypothetical protein